MLQKLLSLVVLLLAVLGYTQGLYIKPSDEKLLTQKRAKVQSNEVIPNNEWSIFQQKLGLTKQKVELLKSQKDQKATMDLVKRFIKENPKHLPAPAAAEHKPETDEFLNVYNALVKHLKLAKRSTLKTSLNFELADKPMNNLKRTRRRIAVKMVSDMPSEKIDDLLAMFNKQYGINDEETDEENDDEIDDDAEDSKATNTYDGVAQSLHSGSDRDYMYDDLYDDEVDLGAPNKSNHNSQYGSFQDLILQAKRNQWQREIEETKLHSEKNEHFI